MSGEIVLGIAASHNGSACLLRGGNVVSGIQEERLSRQKRGYVTAGAPSLCVDYVLKSAGVTIDEVDAVMICSQESRKNPANDVTRNPQLRVAVERECVHRVPHHFGHALSVYHASGFSDAAILVIDGLGSPWSDIPDDERRVVIGARQGSESVSIYHGIGQTILPVQKLVATDMYVNSDGTPYDWINPEPGMPRFRTLGGMYSAISWQLFSDGLEGPGKTMSLAGLAEPSFPVDDFLVFRDNGDLDFRDTVPALFPHNERWPQRRSEYEALAASVQQALEYAVIELADRARNITGSQRICFVGGVALNGIINNVIAKRVKQENLFILPAAEDSGTALGAAYAGTILLGGNLRATQISDDFLGVNYTPEQVQDAAEKHPLIITSQVEDAAVETASLLAQGKIIGWFQGGSEFGPRALGHRSILADPRNPDNKLRLNMRLKQREEFRPFAS